MTNYLEFDPARPPGGGEPCSYRGLDVFCGPLDVERQADRLYRNLGDGRFEDVSRATGVGSRRRAGLGVLFADLDGDGDQDLYVANDSDPNTLYRNDGDWRLREVGALAGAAFSEDGQPQAGMGVDAGDFDRDGDLDLFVTNFADDYNTLYRNDGAGRFTDASAAAGLVMDSRPLLGWSTAFVDFDNDGWLDLFVANGHLYPQLAAHEGGLSYPQADLLYRNREGRFVPVDGGPGWDRRTVGRAAAVGDLDDDGDADLLFVDLNERPALLLNDVGNRRPWIGLRVLDAVGAVAVGARVELFSGGCGRWRRSGPAADSSPATILDCSSAWARRRAWTASSCAFPPDGSSGWRVWKPGATTPSGKEPRRRWPAFPCRPRMAGRRRHPGGRQRPWRCLAKTGGGRRPNSWPAARPSTGKAATVWPRPTCAGAWRWRRTACRPG